ncbi:uncharacterized protein wu:fi34b01 [Hippocampus zosterae]|uniref:uncharacterized protein wu:fi34b01 n=1 Tax=Hippocampus zosterae TaxID=109293 RepID=UPI00223E3645|nr:uncharacterized protein wu:fi34b01 [Hippocampus zosterae]
MAADAPICRTVAVVLLLCSFVPSFSCFPQKSLGKFVPWQLASEKLGVRKGKILFNGEELKSLSESDASGTWEEASQSDELGEVEAAWRLTDPSLRCGPTKMTLKVMGRGAVNLELDLGSGRSLPLSQMPESCGHSLHQNSLGLVLVVSYGGCKVMRENGYHVLPMSFMETSVTLACPVLPPLTPPHPIPPTARNVDRSKRDEDKPASDENLHLRYQHYHNYLKYLYYLHILKNPHMYPLVHRAYNPLYQSPHLVSHAYPYIPVQHPLYAHYPQNPAAPYCHPPGALCPLPHYLNPQPQALQNREILMDTDHSPETLTTTPSPTADPATTTTTAASTTTRKPCRRIIPTTTVSPTAAAATPTKRRCRPRTHPENKHFTPYAAKPFVQEISYDEGAPIAGNPKSSPLAGYKSGPLQSYQYWQQEPWFSQEEDKDIPFDWDELEP